jgi:hypothetical protein
MFPAAHEHREKGDLMNSPLPLTTRLTVYTLLRMDERHLHWMMNRSCPAFPYFALDLTFALLRVSM